jgi:hypothetical protein
MSSKKEVYRARIQDVMAEMKFRCNDGSELKNLEDLANALREMPEETYSHHVTEQNNDFSNWIRDCIQDTTLAKKLVKVTDKNQSREIVQERIDWLKTRA